MLLSDLKNRQYRKMVLINNIIGVLFFDLCYQSILNQNEIDLNKNFSSFSGLHDLIIPKENLLRKISEQIDFTFIYEELLDK